MRAITVKQPYAWAIAAGHKTVENRSAATRYQGPLAIHAGGAWSERGERQVPALLPHDVLPPKWWTKPGVLPRGAIIAVAELVDTHPDTGCCRPWGESEYTEAGGRVRRQVHHLVLDDIRALPEPIAARGQLGLWRPDPDLLNELTRRATPEQPRNPGATTRPVSAPRTDGRVIA